MSAWCLWWVWLLDGFYWFEVGLVWRFGVVAGVLGLCGYLVWGFACLWVCGCFLGWFVCFDFGVSSLGMVCLRLVGCPLYVAAFTNRGLRWLIVVFGMCMRCTLLILVADCLVVSLVWILWVRVVGWLLILMCYLA